MSDKTAIEWTASIQPDGTVTPGSTWNPIRGQTARHTCARISPGCDNCYAATMTRRGLMGTAPLDYGQGETPNDPARLDEKALRLPLTWKKPRKVFVASMTDLFGTWVPDEWIDRICAVMANTPQHTYIVLTKRPTHMRDYFRTLSYAITLFIDRTGDTPELHAMERQRIKAGGRCWPLPNVWVGTTIESDQYAWRADRLRQTPAAVRWVSAEPLLSGLPSLDLTGIDWLVAGGESGPGARPMHPEWPRDLRDRCQASGTAYFFKQHGAWISRHEVEPIESLPPDSIGPERVRWVDPSGDVRPTGQGLMHEGDELMHRVGNHRSGRLLDGVEHNAFPAAQSPAEAAS
jgi:protein gp37